MTNSHLATILSPHNADGTKMAGKRRNSVEPIHRNSNLCQTAPCDLSRPLWSSSPRRNAPHEGGSNPVKASLPRRSAEREGGSCYSVYPGLSQNNSNLLSMNYLRRNGLLSSQSRSKSACRAILSSIVHREEEAQVREDRTHSGPFKPIQTQSCYFYGEVA